MNRFPILKKPSHFLATLFGIGLLPLAPGTWGSLAALIAYLYLVIYLSLSSEIIMLLTASIVIISILVCHLATRQLSKEDKDQKSIVIDELAGLWIAFLPLTGLIMVREILLYSVVAFLLFRLFDIWKPYPISLIDKKMKSGFGVVLDDVVAGIYAAISTSLFLFLFS
jgi:phosphatidylglycerophosphatase A|tara:strand:+ start:77 stop:580 length:504 start_codon:yes stop_codon:yes gene_type:complete